MDKQLEKAYIAVGGGGGGGGGAKLRKDIPIIQPPAYLTLKLGLRLYMGYFCVHPNTHHMTPLEQCLCMSSEREVVIHYGMYSLTHLVGVSQEVLVQLAAPKDVPVVSLVLAGHTHSLDRKLSSLLSRVETTISFIILLSVTLLLK